MSEHRKVHCEDVDNNMTFSLDYESLNRSCKSVSMYRHVVHLTLIRMANKKVLASSTASHRLYDSQATNWKHQEFPERPPPPSAPVYSNWSRGSHVSPLASRNTRKHHHKQVDSLTFLL
jgi:hypothetical protein